MKSHFDPAEYEGEKVTTASDMAAIEKKAIQEEDAEANEYMERAADGIFEIIRSIMIDNTLEPYLIVIAGKGNNGGDGVCVANRFLDAGGDVTVYLLSPIEECSELLQKHAKAFKKRGGQLNIIESADEIEFSKGSLVLDAILGTGFRGKTEGLISKVIEKINKAHNFIVSIDIPSGLPGDTGKVEGSAVYADHTIYLGLIKMGHLFVDGYDHVGELSHVDFGISQKYLDQLKPFGYLVNPNIMSRNLPRHKRTSHKYSIGQLTVIGGSKHMPGAPMLAAEAALRSGAGIVKWFYDHEMYGHFTNNVKEIIQVPYDLTHIDEIKPEIERSKALLLGPGLGRSENVPKLIDRVYEMAKCPIVIDADALYFFKKPNTPAVLTPHRGELIRLLGEDSSISETDLLEKTQKFCDEHDIVIVAKGAPTVVLAKGKERIINARGNPGMATAGSGDVLAGIIASFIAQGMDPRGAAILGVVFHSIAGDLARDQKSEHAMIASDITAQLPEVFLRSERA